MTGIRAFIAIELPPELQKCLKEVSSQLKEKIDRVPVRWVPVENIHLTLKFLGEVSQNNLSMLIDILKSVVSNYNSFEISVGGLGAFPKMQRPRVIWVGVEAPQELMSMQRSIEVETARLGYAREIRPFSPHLTLARVSRNATARDIHKIADVLESQKVGFLGVASVHSAHLFQSELKPGGSVYTSLFTAHLSD